MNIIERYQKARQEIEHRFSGLPYMHKALIGLFLSKAHFSTGIVDDITYQDLCDTLTVKPAPGRKESGAPSKSTLRSALRTIESTFKNDFKIISEGQHLIIQFITLPQLFRKHDLISEEISDQITAVNFQKVKAGSYQGTHSTHVQSRDKIIEVSTASKSKTCDLIQEEICDQIGIHDRPVTPIKTGQTNDLSRVQVCDRKHEEITDLSTALSLITTVNNNKQKTNITTQSLLKRFIAEDFYPSDETIQIALSRGLLKVTDRSEIKKFITYNQLHQSKWSDFNPIFIKWLEREHKQPKALSRNYHDRYPIKSTNYERTMQAVLNANKNARAPNEGGCIKEELRLDRAHPMVVGSNDSYIWPVICE